MAMQSAFQEVCSYTMAVRGLLDVGSVRARRMRAFAEANEMGRGDVSVTVAAAFANSSAAVLPGMPLWPGPSCGWWGLPCCLVAGE